MTRIPALITSFQKVTCTNGVTRTIHNDEGFSLVLAKLEKNSYVPTHSHTVAQITTVNKGAIVFKKGNEEPVILTQGQSIFVPPNMPHSGYVLEYSEVHDFFSPERDDF